MLKSRKIMIKVKHPIEHLNANQEKLLSGMSFDDRQFHALFFSYGNATYIYHSAASNPSLEDFEEWLEGLSEPMRSSFKSEGFEYCTSVLSFTRYVNEKRDVGMDEFVKNLMGEEDYQKYINSVK